MINTPLRLVLVLVLAGTIGLVLSSQPVWAACCLAGDLSDPNNPDYFFCIQSDVPNEYGPIIETEAQCTQDYSGTWNENDCFDVPSCQTGCCCRPEEDGSGNAGLLTTEYICNNIIDSTPGSFFLTGVSGSCNTYCADAATETYSIAGTIYNAEGNPVEGARVEIFYEGVSAGILSSTPDTGEYLINNIPTGIVDIDVFAEPDCNGEELDIQLDSDLTGIDITLSCEGNTGGDSCIPPVWQCTWDDPEDLGRACGWPSNCQNVNPPDEAAGEIACEGPKAPDQPPILPLPCPELSSCGDGEVSGDEECDCGDDGVCSPEELGGMTCEELNMGFDNPGLSCNSDCRLDLSGCTLCPLSDPGSCSEEQCLLDCDICIDNGYCDYLDSCEAFTLNINSVEAVAESDHALVTWSQTDDFCIQHMDRAYIERCETDENGNCISSSYLNMTMDEPQTGFDTINEFTDTNGLEPSPIGEPRKHYCYQVYAVITIDGTETIYKSPSRNCINSGDEICMQEHSIELCADTTLIHTPPEDLIGPEFRSYCDGNNYLQLLDESFPDIVNDQPPFDCAADEYGNDVPCLGPYYSQGELTRCGDPGICEYCNGLLGMYSYLDTMRVPYFMESGLDYRECQEIYADECFEQSTRTTVDKHDSCGEITNCYDYHEESSCLADSCDSVAETCVWNTLEDSENQDNHIGEELGIGVCAPVEEEAQDCTRCNEDDHLSPACTQELCNIYGDSCYYITDGLNEILPNDMIGECHSVDDLGCAFYSTEEECTGGTPVRLDTQYDGAIRISGTNTLFPSADGNFGTCEWVTNNYGASYCIKNADNFSGTDLVDDCRIFPKINRPECWADNEAPSTTIITRPAEFGDFPVYGPHEDTSYSVIVEDHYEQGDLINGNIYAWFALTPVSSYDVLMTNFPVDGSINEQETRYFTGDAACEATGGSCAGVFSYACGDGDWTSIGRNNDDCSNPLSIDVFNSIIQPIPPSIINEYNNKLNNCAWKVSCTPTFQQNYPDQNINEIKTAIVPSTNYNLSYYSQDRAKNLERVKGIIITIDSTPPQLTNYERNNESYELETDVWRTDLHFSYDLEEEHGSSVCEAVLERIDGLSGFAGDISGAGSHFEQDYNYLQDGLYHWMLNCTDRYENRVSYPKIIPIDADKSITNVTPLLQWFNTTSVDIKIDTGTAGTCVYSLTTPYPVSEGGTAFDSSNGHRHTATLSGLASNTIHVAYPGCTFENGRISEGSPGDAMIFSIDQSPPETTLRRANGETYEPIGWTESEDLIFDCSDYHPYLVYPIQETTISLYAGMDHVDYCLSKDVGINPETDCNLHEWDGTPVHIDNETVAALGGYARLYYSCTDQGMNQEDWQETAILVKDTRFDRPRIQICDPITLNCRPTEE